MISTTNSKSENMLIVHSAGEKRKCGAGGSTGKKNKISVPVIYNEKDRSALNGSSMCHRVFYISVLDHHWGTE